MEQKPQQDLSLLPGIYYHPEAAYASASYPDGTLLWRHHWLHGKLHGVCEEYWTNGTPRWRRHYLHGELHGLWELYYKDGTLEGRRHYLHRKAYGLWEEYYKDGTPEKLAWYSEGNQIPFFIEVLLGISILDI
jgi:antitoxin component YwqK of YwqJK toxin-antitoxin module